MITLNARLAAVASHLSPGRPFADIGTDHAYLPAYLVKRGLVPHAIAADVVPGPLDAARTTVTESGLADRIDLRLGSGLQVLRPGEVPQVTICGMGGPLIAEILAAGPTTGIERLVLQPMGGEERLRFWLAAHGWRLTDEELVADGARIYLILVAERGEMWLSEGEMVVGPHLRRRSGPLLLQYVKYLQSQSRRALAGAEKSSRPETIQRIAALRERLKLLEEVIYP